MPPNYAIIFSLGHEILGISSGIFASLMPTLARAAPASATRSSCLRAMLLFFQAAAKILVDFDSFVVMLNVVTAFELE
jgi:hypothetical protein